MASSSASSHPLARPPPAKKRGSYNCGRCGVPKKGHVCHLPPSPAPLAQKDNKSRRALCFDEDPAAAAVVVKQQPLFLTEQAAVEQQAEPFVGVGRGGSVPTSVLMEVFKRVPPQGIVAAGRVSRGWRGCVKRMYRLSEELMLMVSPQCTFGSVGSLLQSCAGLAKMKLNMKSDATVQTLHCLAFYCSKLESLEINMVDGSTNWIHGEGLLRFLADKKQLSELIMEGCENLGHLNLSSTSLSKLFLSDLHCLSKSVFNCPNMREISLIFSQNENESTDLVALMENLGRTCNKLRSLEVNSTRLCNEAVLALASANLRWLKSLSLMNGSTITDAAVASIIQSFPNLELLNLSGSSITDSAIGMICQSYSSTLSHLFLSSCPNITSSGIQLAVAQLPNLTLLDCSMSLAVPNNSENQEMKSRLCEETGKPNPRQSSCQKLFIEHSSLKKLSLWNCSALEGLYVNCPELIELNLNFCTNLHPERLLLQCPNLERIYVFACEDMVIGAIRNQVLNEFAAAKADFCRKRLADGSKRVLVPHSLSYFGNDEEEKCNKRQRRNQCSVIL
ncbi:hypothetical protein LUZ60_005336 [Juncus effusus]|nr:hypothetical protein LUZ60_005336 [Juncus effusus]